MDVMKETKALMEPGCVKSPTINKGEGTGGTITNLSCDAT
uniref:Uncharacterized protein n=1 Tax=Utricularia reniformis TaxID=192314 RepID=A0A1Y0B1R7_9LAMI|nr:hypothetical protein AEK19_MT1077 [Utricularia reniformis]ART31299.1 hypothetical protein AEK19_MT1077 [Utricularia reniformis]